MEKSMEILDAIKAEKGTFYRTGYTAYGAVSFEEFTEWLKKETWRPDACYADRYSNFLWESGITGWLDAEYDFSDFSEMDPIEAGVWVATERLEVEKYIF
jgi:hypothetical protein